METTAMQKKSSLVTRLIAVTLVSMLSIATIAATPVAAKNNTSTSLQVPIIGTTSAGGTFQGTAAITSFAGSGNNVVAVGTISGVVNGTQSVVSTFTAPVTLPSATAAAPAADAAAACQILNLMLGPVNLNVLGLVISIPNPV